MVGLNQHDRSSGIETWLPVRNFRQAVLGVLSTVTWSGCGGDNDITVGGNREAKIYWTNGAQVGAEIQRSNLDGSHVEALFNIGATDARGISVEAGVGKIYWTDSSTGKILRAELDGTSVEDLVTTGLESPTGIAVDSIFEKIYWTDAGTRKVYRSSLHGTAVQTLVSVRDGSPLFIALRLTGE